MTTMRQPAPVGFKTSGTAVANARARGTLWQLTTCFHDNARPVSRPQAKRVADRRGDIVMWRGLWSTWFTAMLVIAGLILSTFVGMAQPATPPVQSDLLACGRAATVDGTPGVAPPPGTAAFTPSNAA